MHCEASLWKPHTKLTEIFVDFTGTVATDASICCWEALGEGRLWPSVPGFSAAAAPSHCSQ